MTTVSKMFSYHKLFTTGDFVILLEDVFTECLPDDILSYFNNTDLDSFWDQ